LYLVQFQNISYHTFKITASLINSDTGETLYSTVPMILVPDDTGTASYQLSRGHVNLHWDFDVKPWDKGPRQ
jgi:hypothetical protein